MLLEGHGLAYSHNKLIIIQKHECGNQFNQPCDPTSKGLNWPLSNFFWKKQNTNTDICTQVDWLKHTAGYSPDKALSL